MERNLRKRRKKNKKKEQTKTTPQQHQKQRNLETRAKRGNSQPLASVASNVGSLAKEGGARNNKKVSHFKEVGTKTVAVSRVVALNGTRPG
jgi:hypothetical protein